MLERELPFDGSEQEWIVEGRREAEAAAAHPPTAHVDPAVNANPQWRSIRRRVAGRIRRSLPEYDGVVQTGVVEVAPEVVVQ